MIESFAKYGNTDGCYGAYQIEISEEELEAVKSGKVLYYVISGGEHAIALTAKGNHITVKFKKTISALY